MSGLQAKCFNGVLFLSELRKKIKGKASIDNDFKTDINLFFKHFSSALRALAGNKIYKTKR